MIQFLVLLASASVALGSPAGFGYHGRHIGYPHPKCTRELEKVTRKFCKLELEKTCSTETKTFTKITGFEKGECKDIEVCTRTPKEVCEEKEIEVPRLVCEDKKE